jgi:hypothetical protein
MEGGTWLRNEEEEKKEIAMVGRRENASRGKK